MAAAKKRFERECIICGKIFMGFSNQKTCSSECRLVNDRAHQRDYWHRHKLKTWEHNMSRIERERLERANDKATLDLWKSQGELRREKAAPPQVLIDEQKEARKLGLSYGTYKAYKENGWLDAYRRRAFHDEVMKQDVVNTVESWIGNEHGRANR